MPARGDAGFSPRPDRARDDPITADPRKTLEPPKDERNGVAQDSSAGRPAEVSGKSQNVKAFIVENLIDSLL